MVELPGIEIVIDTNATDSRGTFPFLVKQTKEVKDITVSGFSHLVLSVGDINKEIGKGRVERERGGRETVVGFLLLIFCFVLFLNGRCS